MMQVHSILRSILQSSMLLIAVMFALPAEAQLIPCSSAGGAGTYKIFVDEVRAGSGGGSGGAAAGSIPKNLQGLRDFVVSDLTTLTAGHAAVCRCDRRFPLGSADFDDTEMNSLDNLRVLLEVWGVADDPANGRGVLGFVLVPAWQLTPPAVYVVKRGGASFLTEAKRGAELRAFAPLALGIRSYRNLQYDDAIPLLCQGTHQLDVLLANPSAIDPSLQSDVTKLLANVRKLTSDAIKSARRAPGSRYGLLQPTASGEFTCPHT
jgi:hypothetical protein